jgi:flagellin
MSLVVNTNVSSINSQRQLGKVQLAMTKSLERLSSGLRINHSSDDAAGLAISTGMNAQTTGMEQAVRNANDGLSVIQTADGAISEQVEILQRIRVLAVQASSDLNSADNLKSIQEEINQQVTELTRIGNTTNFNGMSLINGTFSSKSIQVGANAGETIDLSIGDYRAAYMGGYAEKATTNGNVTTAIAGGGDVTLGALGGTAVNIAQSTSDGVSAYFSNQSAIAKATAVNASTSQHGVTATVGKTTLTGTVAVAAGGTIATGASFKINGVTIFQAGDVVSTAANDSTGTLRALINSKSTQTGVVASWDTTANRLVLTASDGRNIVVDEVAGVAGTPAGSVAATSVAGFTAGLGSGSSIDTAHVATGSITLTSNTDFVVGGTADNLIGNGITRATYNVTGKTVATIDVTDKTNNGASSAIRSVDSALAKITNEQAKLGAMSNRFTHTISNLQISIENLTAARSRITDTDFAVETASLTRAQIIQQAGTAMLSQANTLPQAALNLLK